MKLLRCHIVNYGCLHDISFSFTDGINLINQPNGWGKSTLASFLCAMLYGLESTTRRNLLENERKHYRPWQGGTFGGWLDFEVSGKQYHLERFFGLKEREDSFQLYDLQTMQPNFDYTQETGLELFGIDKASCLRSIYISQEKTTSGSYDTLTARLAQLTESTDDMNAYDDALKKIDSALRFYVKTGNRGEIARLEQEAVSIEQQLSEAKAARKKLAENLSQTARFYQEKQQFEQQLQTIQGQIAALTQQEIQAHYTFLDRQRFEKEQELERIETFFRDQLPEEGDLNAYMQSCTRLASLEQQKQVKMLHANQTEDFHLLRHFFAESPDAEFTAFTSQQKQMLLNSPEYHDDAALLFSIEERIAQNASDLAHNTDGLAHNTDNLAHNANDIAEHITDAAHRSNNEQVINSDCSEKKSKNYKSLVNKDEIKSDKTDTMKFKPKEGVKSNKTEFPNKGILWLAFAIGILFISIGIACLSTLSAALWFCIPAELLCTLIFQHLSSLQAIFLKNFTPSQTEDSNSTDLASPVEPSHETNSGQQINSGQQTNFDQQTNADAEFLLEQLAKKQYFLYKQLKKRYYYYCDLEQQQKKITLEIQQLRNDLNCYLQVYFSISSKESVTELEEKLQYLKMQLIHYKKLLTELRLASQNINNFLKDHPDFQTISGQKLQNLLLSKETADSESLSTLQQKERICRQKLTDCVQQISFLQAQRQSVQALAETTVSLEDKKQNIYQEIETYKKHHQILTQTKHYLTQAKHQFTNHYIHSIEQNFHKYADLLEKDNFTEAAIDSNFQVLLSQEGIFRQPEWYSLGERNLIDFCFRLSIIEDLFSSEKPFLILDDPFVNLDDTCFHKIHSLLQEMGEEWQILYFTCHSSREIFSADQANHSL